MGWLFTEGMSKKALISELNAEEPQKNGSIYRTVASCVRGSTLWQVQEVVKPDGTSERFIMCNLMESQAGYGWGYKDVDESMGPNDYSCPLSYLDMASPPESAYSAEWRENVRAWHKQSSKLRTLGYGAMIETSRDLDFGHSDFARTFKLVDTKKFYWYAVELGMMVKISKDYLRRLDWTVRP